MEKTDNVAVDNVLNTVSDEYLKQRKRKKQISYSIILGVAFVLAVLIIVFASVKVDLKPYFLEEASKYEVTINGKITSTYISEDEDYNEFYSLYSNAFSTSYLTAMFTGKLGDYKVVQTKDDFYSNNDSKTGMTSKLKSYLGSNYIHLYYAAEQNVFNADGSKATSIFNTDYNLIYTDVYFPINAENKDDELTFYFGTYGYGQARITTITVRANTYPIYDLIANK